MVNDTAAAVPALQRFLNRAVGVFVKIYTVRHNFAHIVRPFGHERPHGGRVVFVLAAKIPGSVWFNTFEEVADYVLAHAQNGDLVLTLGCGDIYKAAKIMIHRLQGK